MRSATEIHPTLAKAISAVVDELASEIDLHYEDDQLVATASTIEKMDHLVTFLLIAGYPAPETYRNVIARYHRCLN